MVSLLGHHRGVQDALDGTSSALLWLALSLVIIWIFIPVVAI